MHSMPSYARWMRDIEREEAEDRAIVQAESRACPERHDDHQPEDDDQYTCLDWRDVCVNEEVEN